jgi:hypothetical protein
MKMDRNNCVFPLFFPVWRKDIVSCEGVLGRVWVGFGENGQSQKQPQVPFGFAQDRLFDFITRKYASYFAQDDTSESGGGRAREGSFFPTLRAVRRAQDGTPGLLELEWRTGNGNDNSRSLRDDKQKKQTTANATTAATVLAVAAVVMVDLD